MSAPTSAAREPRAAFTLIELLVVIAVIALLIGLLLPMLGKARRQGRVAVTLSRLRDLGMSVSLYASNNRDRNPVLQDREEKAYLGLSLLGREHELPLVVFLNPNLREAASELREADGRPVLITLGDAPLPSATLVGPGNLGQVSWHLAYAYDNDVKRRDDGRDRAYLGDRGDYDGGRTFSANWEGEGQCVVWTDQHAVFLKRKSIAAQDDPNLYHHNEFEGEGGDEIVDGVAVTRATLDTHLRVFSEEEDDELLHD